MRVVRWMKMLVALTGPLWLLVANDEALARPSRRTADVAYVAANAPDYDAERHRLDVYAPRRKAGASYPVVVFIHGGNWNSGRKEIYRFVGRRLAKQGVVAVVINYRLAPQVQVPAMANDCARAVRWTKEHIGEFGGDPGRIYLMGHSAGGGLAALLATNDALFAQLGLPQNPVRGVILNDPAGLNMYAYLQKKQYPDDSQYVVAFGTAPAGWRQVSPYYYLTPKSPPFLVFVGGETYGSIASSSEEFRQRLTELGHQPGFTVMKGKKHVPMVLQLYWKNNMIYRQLLPFVGAKPQPEHLGTAQGQP
ncbi:alpha/beta hydrolase [Hymenobacter oligotrophus]|nr:alpha/beta hydrolase [Hymenobacter oligotrophus]